MLILYSVFGIRYVGYFYQFHILMSRHFFIPSSLDKAAGNELYDAGFLKRAFQAV